MVDRNAGRFHCRGKLRNLPRRPAERQQRRQILPQLHLRAGKEPAHLVARRMQRVLPRLCNQQQAQPLHALRVVEHFHTALRKTCAHKGVCVRASLTDMIRNNFHLTSVKKGCEVGECGACTVLIDGEAINSCLYLAVWAEGKNIITLEGLMNPDGTLSDIQKAFIDETAIQCGFCTPGFILTATEILNAGVEYTDDELRKLLSGHLCRCTGYQNIFRAVKKTMLRRLGKDAEAELVK